MNGNRLLDSDMAFRVSAVRVMILSTWDTGPRADREVIMGIKQAPYILLNGQAAEALEFYRDVFGGTIDVTRYGDMPMDDVQGDPNWVMHGQVELENGVTIMASDAGEDRSGPSKVEICVYGDDKDELEGLYNALQNGGSVTFPFDRAPWGSWFGQLVDRFGVAWMIEGGAEQQG